ncbi:ureidoglycolate lyase [Paracoccaceae bacterium GXU_MW_L88]
MDRSRHLVAQPLTAEGFAPFGEIIQRRDAPSKVINRGMCDRHHALASVELSGEGTAVINIFHGRPYTVPLMLDLMERHPLGSQCFVPLGPHPWLAVVAHDDGGKPGTPHPFLVPPGIGLNYPRGLWHAVLTTLYEEADFLVIDRDGPGNNLEEYNMETPWQISLPNQHGE